MATDYEVVLELLNEIEPTKPGRNRYLISEVPDWMQTQFGGKRKFPNWIGALLQEARVLPIL